MPHKKHNKLTNSGIGLPAAREKHTTDPVDGMPIPAAIILPSERGTTAKFVEVTQNENKKNNTN